ncbi:hypothetical protein [Thermoflexus sp.]|mgnify:CR=1 FL=1|uniref:hypothetical protein n=1 Tax=Thermoflexus sp. TaxID=1969742 RepID=UPI001774025F|nr:hypothetical protein [Thermoflexus sp.]
MDPRVWMRKALIQMALRRARPGAGSRWEFLARRSPLSGLPDLRSILDPIPWAVVGALAARYYMPERATQDFDIAVHAKDGSEVRRRLREAGFQYGGELAIPGSSWVSPEGVRLDVLELHDPWAGEALEAAQGNRDDAGLPIMPMPYLILMKFEAGRLQDLADIARMLGPATSEQFRAVYELFQRYRPADLEDLESLRLLGRMERMGPGESAS